MYQIVLFLRVLRFFHREETTAIKKKTFWLDVRGNIFTMPSQAVGDPAQRSCASPVPEGFKDQTE